MSANYLFLLLFQGLLLAAGLMLGSWMLAHRMRNASIIAAAWPGLLCLLATVYASLGDGYGPRRLVVFAMVAIWGLRLSLFQFRRIRARLPNEDQRYAALRKEWGGSSDIKFLIYFELQGILALLLSLPLALSCLDPTLAFSPNEYAAMLLWLIGLTGETLADRQLSRFQADPSNREKTLDRGLWRYSRHPNYFFEWLIWCSFFVFALSAPHGWATIYCPVVMYYLLNRITGASMTESFSLRNRGESYRIYQERTHRFFPWFQKQSS